MCYEENILWFTRRRHNAVIVSLLRIHIQKKCSIIDSRIISLLKAFDDFSNSCDAALRAVY